ncbi:MAG: DAK2 domain-containing protein, partial [Rhodococcus sp. (in: high G+C Gram-positive bacteria)]
MDESVDTSATVGDRNAPDAVTGAISDAQNDVVLDDVVLDDVVLDVDRVRQWAYRCVDGLTDRCDEINELNVFPIADSDTGTNLVFTVRAAVESMRGAGPEADLTTVTAALAHGAVSGARGNSGVIASQLMRALAEAAADRTVLSGTDVRGALHRAAQLAADVVSVPVEGTIVTVLESSAAAVAALEPNEGVVAVVRRAVEAA